MRMLNGFINDVKFQFKYGFYLLYLVLTSVYLGVIFAVPLPYRELAIAIVVFSDPVAIGLFFMGALVLFEKSERVLDSIFISPLKVSEYILAKIMSLAVISVAVGLAIGFTAAPASISFWPLFWGLALGSTLFSLAGLIVAARINSLNQFMLTVIPLALFLSLPPFILFFWDQGIWLYLHPGATVLRLIQQGLGLGVMTESQIYLQMILLIFWNSLFWIWAKKNIQKMISKLGGIKL